MPIEVAIIGIRPEAGGKVDKANLTQVGRALSHLGIELIPAYSPEARGRSERMFGALQKRLPQELRIKGITTMQAANGFLKEEYLPAHNERFAVSSCAPGSAFVAFAGELNDVLCVQEERIVGKDNTVRYKNRSLQIPADCHRNHYVKARIRVHEYPDGRMAIFHGPRKLALYDCEGKEIKEVKKQAARTASTSPTTGDGTWDRFTRLRLPKPSPVVGLVLSIAFRQS